MSDSSDVRREGAKWANEPQLNIDLLNEQAKFLYDAAFDAGRQAGMRDQDSVSANQQAAINHRFVSILLRGALDTEDDDHARWISSMAGWLLYRTPLVAQPHDATSIRYRLQQADLYRRAGKDSVLKRKYIEDALAFNDIVLEEMGWKNRIEV